MNTRLMRCFRQIGNVGITVIFIFLRSWCVESQSTTPAAIPPNTTRIAFVKASNIYIMNLNGSNQEQITAVEPGPSEHPTWSPKHPKLAFDAVVNEPPNSSHINSEIFVIDVDSRVQERLTKNDSNDIYPVWSPNGDKIAFASDRDGDWEVYVMNTNGTEQINLTNNHEANDGNQGLTWSPDGNQIAFVSDRNEGINENTGFYEAEGIYVLNVQEVENLNNYNEVVNLTSQINECPAGEFYQNPSWSVGNQLAFALSCGLNWDIYVLKVKTTPEDTEEPKYSNLTNSPNAEGVLGLNWSPDGKQIVYVANTTFNKPSDQEIFVMDVSEIAEEGTKQIKQLTDEPQTENHYAFPAWEIVNN